ncbi:MAG TPA: ABC transporter permease subunit [Streptosporangiales bacterium]
MSPPASDVRTGRADALRRNRPGYLLIGPSVVLLLAVFVGGMLTLLEYSFHRVLSDGTDISGTLATWRDLVTNAHRWDVLRQTVELGVIVTAVTALVGWPTAYALHRIRSEALRYLGLFVVFAPLLTSVIARTYGWELILGDDGVLNALLGAVGLGGVKVLYTQTSVVVALVHILLPFMVFPLTSSLRQLDPALVDAAGDLGAGPFTRFRRVVLPLTLPGLIAGMQLVFALTISSFATPALLGGGRVQVMATTVYDDVNNVDWPMAAAVSYSLLAVAVVALALFGMLQRRVRRGNGGGVTAAASTHSAGLLWSTWLGVIYVFVLAPLVVIVVNSFSSVSYGAWPPPAWSTKWYANLFAQEGLGSAVVLSLEVAVAATVLATVLGTAAALAFVRYRPAGARVLESFALSPTVVPKVAFGFAGFVFLHRISLFGGVLGLVLTHVVVTLPFVLIVMTAALVRTDATLDEAAADLGARPLRAFLAATLPQVRSAVVASALFAFIVSFDEVDMTVFLLSPQQNTLPVWMFTYMQKYQDPTLAALSSILIAVAVLLAAVVAVLFARSGALSALAGDRQRQEG